MRQLILVTGLLLFLGLAPQIGEAIEDDNAERVADLEKVISSEYDEMDDVTWHKHKDEDRAWGIGVYIGESEDDIWLRFYAGTRGPQWLNFNKLTILLKHEDENIEDYRIIIDVDPLEVNAYVTQKNWDYGHYCNERLDLPVGERITLTDLVRIAEADEVKMRFSGEGFNRDCNLKGKTHQSIIDMLDYYELVFGHRLPEIDK